VAIFIAALKECYNSVLNIRLKFKWKVVTKYGIRQGDSKNKGQWGEGQGARSKVKDRWIPDRVRDDREGVRGRLIGCGDDEGERAGKIPPCGRDRDFPFGRNDKRKLDLAFSA